MHVLVCAITNWTYRLVPFWLKRFRRENPCGPAERKSSKVRAIASRHTCACLAWPREWLPNPPVDDFLASLFVDIAGEEGGRNGLIDQDHFVDTHESGPA